MEVNTQTSSLNNSRRDFLKAGSILSIGISMGLFPTDLFANDENGTNHWNAIIQKWNGKTWNGSVQSIVYPLAPNGLKYEIGDCFSFYNDTVLAVPINILVSNNNKYLGTEVLWFENNENALSKIVHLNKYELKSIFENINKYNQDELCPRYSQPSEAQNAYNYLSANNSVQFYTKIDNNTAITEIEIPNISVISLL